MSQPFPTFLIIGAQKGATRWLRVNLGKHPDVFTASRELEFFNHHFDNGVRAYLAKFEGHSGEAHIGEATPGYMMWNEKPHVIAGRIDGLLPQVRLIAVLRNPIDRAHSAFLHHKRRGRIQSGQDLLELVRSVPPEDDPLSLVSGGWYGASLFPYVRRFGPRLAVFLNESIKDSPANIYRAALSHLGADPTFAPNDLDEVLFSNRQHGDRRNSLGRSKRQELREYFLEDIRRLERLVDLDLEPWKDFGS